MDFYNATVGCYENLSIFVHYQNYSQAILQKTCKEMMVKVGIDNGLMTEKNKNKYNLVN